MGGSLNRACAVAPSRTICPVLRRRSHPPLRNPDADDPSLTRADSAMRLVARAHERRLKLYNRITDKCFKDCVHGFRKKSLANDEERVGHTTRAVRLIG